MDNEFGQLSILIKKISDYKNILEDYSKKLIFSDEGEGSLPIEEDENTLFQKNEENLNELIKVLCISVLCGEYIKFENFYGLISGIEKDIEDIPSSTNDFPYKIQQQIFEICSTLVILIEHYKEFCKKIENYYSDDRLDVLFQRNTLIQKELSKETIKKETKNKILFFINLLMISQIDHFPTVADKQIIDIFNSQTILENFSDPLFRDVKSVIFEKLLFLKYKWKERKLQENPFMHYQENGEHKQIEEITTINEGLIKWKDIIQTQYELSSNWKVKLAQRVKAYKNFPADSIFENLQLHQLIKYFKDIESSNSKLSEIYQKLISDKNTYISGVYERYVRNIFSNYAVSNEFSNYIENINSIEEIAKKYNYSSSLISSTNNYFLKFKYLDRIFDLLILEINKLSKKDFVEKYKTLIEKSKVILDTYEENINWSLTNFNYIFLLPFKESTVNFKIDNVDYPIFFASSFVLPPSAKNIKEGYESVKEKFNKLFYYLEVSQYLVNEINEIEGIKDDLSKKEVKSIELLSLFTAVISFIIGGISGFSFIKDLYTALLFFVVFTTSLLTFLIALFVFTRGKEILEENKIFIRWLYGIFILSIISLFASNLIKSKYLNDKTDIQRIEEKLKRDSIKNSVEQKPIISTQPTSIYIQTNRDSIE